MTHTTNFNLTQWAKSDRIQMADFNADNAKLDAALAALTRRVYTATYTGDGAYTKTFTFPAKPAFVVTLTEGELSFMVRGSAKGVLHDLANFYEFPVSGWDGTTLTLTGGEYICTPNALGAQYALFAILEGE